MIFTSIKHPRSNGQAEVSNKVILRGLKQRLTEASARWVEEFPTNRVMVFLRGRLG